MVSHVRHSIGVLFLEAWVEKSAGGHCRPCADGRMLRPDGKPVQGWGAEAQALQHPGDDRQRASHHSSGRHIRILLRTCSEFFRVRLLLLCAPENGQTTQIPRICGLDIHMGNTCEPEPGICKHALFRRHTLRSDCRQCHRTGSGICRKVHLS